MFVVSWRVRARLGVFGRVLGDPGGGFGGLRSVLDGLGRFWNGFHGVCASSGCLWTDLEWFWNGFLGVCVSSGCLWKVLEAIFENKLGWKTARSIQNQKKTKKSEKNEKKVSHLKVLWGVETSIRLQSGAFFCIFEACKNTLPRIVVEFGRLWVDLGVRRRWRGQSRLEISKFTEGLPSFQLHAQTHRRCAAD